MKDSLSNVRAGTRVSTFRAAGLRGMRSAGFRRKRANASRALSVRRRYALNATPAASRSIARRITFVAELLRAQGPRLQRLYAQADARRRKSAGDDIFLRGIIEISSYCRNDCFYCGLRRSRHQERYRLSEEEILEICRGFPGLGITTVVLQAGEDEYFSRERVGALVRRIKQETPVSVTLCLGERDPETYRFWRKQGMDRYFMRFETSQPRLFNGAHPDSTLEHRLHCLRALQRMGVQTGSGFLIGLPGETIEDLAADIVFCSRLSLDMIGVGPFIPHPQTPYAGNRNELAGEIMDKTIALLRLLNPDSHIAATTAFDAIAPGSRLRLLQQGANIFMPNATPPAYRSRYELYPGKPAVDMPLAQAVACLRDDIVRIKRRIGTGPGHSRRTAVDPAPPRNPFCGV